MLSKYHERGVGEVDFDNFKRMVASVYGRLFARSSSTRNVSWTNLRVQRADINNLFSFTQVNGSLFHDIFETNRAYLPNGELVDLHDNYDNCKCFLSDDGLCGFAIEPDGNLVSVFSLNPSTKKGFLYAIKDFVKEQGATHLDAYASKNQNLETIYKKTLGYQVASRMDYNMEYDHDDIATNHGTPDLVFMVLSDHPVKERHFNKDQYDEAQQYAQENAIQPDHEIRFSRLPKEEDDEATRKLRELWNEVEQKATEEQSNTQRQRLASKVTEILQNLAGHVTWDESNTISEEERKIWKGIKKPFTNYFDEWLYCISFKIYFLAKKSLTSSAVIISSLKM